MNITITSLICIIIGFIIAIGGYNVAKIKEEIVRYGSLIVFLLE